MGKHGLRVNFLQRRLARQFGSGTIGDFACHHLDPAFWALKLDRAEKFQVEASSYGANEEICPAASLIHYGTKGAILGGGWGRSPRIVPESRMKAY